ncbi:MULTISPECIES: NADH-dependent FMN reductase RutF [unclassified Marinobacter]|jgi:flavin reductase|uniref:FMN reductase (NADH) RutF n=1 Tax=Marinobacter adhaerens TaxID=1033846 RepID=A0A352IVL2_9GAMM|nr:MULTISPECIES: pyrimidine utilization flavin reductase protein F [unclassified Marinobacter]MAK51680.1 pyrimidine utilization flavin reductase protein F [Marinobacter sp.]MBI46996.1 pyrimidine utilization flavin reductase protein F [Marinobacter sp.]OUW75977.1 MAG: pyrimidine utilization flavin reductase protein F [Saprospirales bacterium TMED214]HBC35495.1 pyrimidine utilization flavin reductase protein F [Marinobacter adhaerens]|tara:strand:- start:13901 stop:14428 length:528 start_codon:yes stop_codon:yes gene_type:complete
MKPQPQLREVLAMPPLVDKQSFRNAMSTLAAAVSVVTTDGPGGRAGFTATAVCSVCDEPPTLLVCLNRGASVYDAFQQNDSVCVNTLADHQSDLSNLFGSKTTMDQRFAGAQWSTAVTGAPVLEDALVSFDCTVSKRVSVGTHDILFCAVANVRQQDEVGGLVYFDRGYHCLKGK